MPWLDLMIRMILLLGGLLLMLTGLAGESPGQARRLVTPDAVLAAGEAMR